MPKLVMMPPQSERSRKWAEEIIRQVSQYQVVLPETDEETRSELVDADAVFGWVPPEMLPLAQKLRWLQSPAAGPKLGFYYQELVDHPVKICNPRGVYNDHIGQHILMYMLALARGLPYYIGAQLDQRWDTSAQKSQYVDLTKATALIVGVGGIGHETARLCLAFGMRVLGIDARWEYEVSEVEKHPP
ncbi:hydroxyacid dehydrogenase, partial [Candidatus Poribacteria bacterium]|nr:hydroxyacid dehydrogenase [Candidatus Poribacteria bacterium]